MDKLVQYFMQETDKKFSAIRSDLSSICLKLEDLTQFKSEMVASAKLTSIVVSTIFGLLTLAVSVYAAIQVKK